MAQLAAFEITPAGPQMVAGPSEDIFDLMATVEAENISLSPAAQVMEKVAGSWRTFVAKVSDGLA